VLGDVSVPSDCQRIADVAGEQLGGIDVLCANAGIDPTSPLSELTEAAIDRVLATNLKGCMLSVVACLPRLKLSGHGRIILTSSITGPITGFPAVSVYAASKAGQLGFMRAAALELAGSRITMNAVLPGTILTERIAGDAAFLEQVAVRVPLGRVGTVDDIGNTVLFLATDEAGYITGQTIVVDGGLVLPEFQSITLT
jgi:3-oxoacyl-[acyl-carrier protein] reductase